MERKIKSVAQKKTPQMSISKTKQQNLQGAKTGLNKMSEVRLNQINTLQDKEKDIKLQLENCSK